MKKLQTLAFYTLVTPAIALGSSALMAQDSGSSQADREGVNTQQGYDLESSTDSSDSKLTTSDQSSRDQTDMQDKSGMQAQSGMDSEDYMNSAPANSMQASNLIGANVKTTGDEEVGAISDLIIDEDGKIAAVLVGVGGFLGMGEKEVAISWDKVTKSGTGEDQELRIEQTRESLQDAPEFEKQD